jgi:hypothetical protein
MNPAVGQSPGPASRARTSLEFVGDTRQVVGGSSQRPLRFDLEGFPCGPPTALRKLSKTPRTICDRHGFSSRLVDSGACPDWCKIQVTWFDHLAGQNVACRWSYPTLDGLDRFNKGALMTGSEPSQLKRMRGAQ